MSGPIVVISLAISGEPAELHVAAYREQDIAECLGQPTAHCRLQLRYLKRLRGRPGDERANVAPSRGQDVLHFAELGENIHRISLALVG